MRLLYCPNKDCDFVVTDVQYLNLHVSLAHTVFKTDVALPMLHDLIDALKESKEEKFQWSVVVSHVITDSSMADPVMDDAGLSLTKSSSWVSVIDS